MAKTRNQPTVGMLGILGAKPVVIVPYLLFKIWSHEPSSSCFFFFDPVLQWDTLLPNDAWASMESGVRRWDGCFGAGFDLSDFGRPASFLSTRMFHTWKSSIVQQHCWYDTTYHVSFRDILNINTCKTLVYTIIRIHNNTNEYITVYTFRKYELCIY